MHNAGGTSMNKEDSALSLDAQVYLHDIEKADILVGIPSFNNVLTASYVISQVTKGLDTYFPNLKSVIFVSDGNSKDETLIFSEEGLLAFRSKVNSSHLHGIIRKRKGG